MNKPDDRIDPVKNRRVASRVNTLLMRYAPLAAATAQSVTGGANQRVALVIATPLSAGEKTRGGLGDEPPIDQQTGVITVSRVAASKNRVILVIYRRDIRPAIRRVNRTRDPAYFGAPVNPTHL
jgi:hypothetical protein